MAIEYVNRSEYQEAQRRLKAISRKEEIARQARKQSRKNIGGDINVSKQ